MEPYTLGALQIYHFDFYRFTASEEWREAGFDELIGANASLSLVEWPEMAEQSLAPPDLWMRLNVLASSAQSADEDHVNEDDPSSSRVLEVQAFSDVGQNLIERVLKQ
jgi:tRNA threonylcarbamoyladenosine biosynthesis protein TsaE